MKLFAYSILALTLVSTSASAQGYPIRAKEGRAAPHGYSRSGDYYVPNSDRARTALPKRSGDTCPHGFSPSGGACLSTR